MLIGELCKKTGLGKGAIRLYEQLGLISSKPRQAGSRVYREFDENTLTRIELIKNGKRMGFKLKEGKAIIDAFMNDEMTIEQRCNLLEKRLDGVEEKIEQLSIVKNEIKMKLKSLRES